MAQKLGLSSEAMLRDLVPDDPEKVAAYLNLMMNDGETDRLYEPASRLVDLNYKPVLGMILGNTETLFLKGRTSQALALWNKAIAARWLDLAKLEPTSGKSLTHKDFRGERTGVGFDWHYSGVDGVSVSTAESDGSLRLEFSGKEPQNCDLASQLVPLLPGRKYRLAVKYWSDSIPSGSGLQWGVYPANGGQALVTIPLNSPPGAPAELSAYLDTPAVAMPLKLQLSYARAPGMTRAEGVLNVQSVDLVLNPMNRLLSFLLLAAAARRHPDRVDPRWVRLGNLRMRGLRPDVAMAGGLVGGESGGALDVVRGAVCRHRRVGLSTTLERLDGLPFRHLPGHPAMGRVWVRFFPRLPTFRRGREFAAVS